MKHIVQITPHLFNVSAKTNWVFISVTDSDGQVGWGEASLIGWEPLLVEATRALAGGWQGSSLADAQRSLRVSAQSPGGLVFNTAISAALQAIASLNFGIHGSLLRHRVPAYANINRATLRRTPQGFVETALRARARGFTRFKAAPFDGLTPALCASSQGDELISHGVNCMLALRDALGPDVQLMVDCHWRFDEDSALSALKAMKPARLHWFECPIAETHSNWHSMRRIRAAAHDQGVLLAAAETQVGLAAFKTLFDEELYDLVMPDVKYCGGPAEMLRIAEQAHARGVGFSPHNPSGPVCTWHSLQVAAMAPECAMLELQFDESPLYDAVMNTAAITPAGGHFDVSGLYLDPPSLDIGVLDAHPYQPVPLGIESLLNS